MHRDDHSERAYAGMADAELARAAARGDTRAFVEIVRRYQSMVCGIALGVLGDFAASEDAAQEAFVAAWKKIEGLREPARLRAWLSQIARNAALAHRRGQRVHEGLDHLALLEDEAPGPDDVVARQEDTALVRELLARLPELYRTPLVLYYREGQSVCAVAEALGVSEDAVKQRLARGREMLRDRVSGLIETVLTSTGPTSQFTLAVAASIGALATPAAAAAGTALSCASASAECTSAATNASTTILTAMSTSKTILLTTVIAAVTFAPIGFFAGSRSPISTPTMVPASAPGASGMVPQARDLIRESEFVAEWRRLHDLYGTTPQAMPLLYNAIDEIKNPFRQRAFRTALMAEWVQVDPVGGLAFMLGKGPDDEQRQLFLREWLARDPAGAVNALLRSGSGWEMMARQCLPEIARSAPARLAEVASRLPKAQYGRDKSVRDAFALLAEADLNQARQASEGVTGPSRQQALAGIAQHWAKREVDAALDWAKGLTGEVDRDEIIRDALIGSAAVDPIGALERIGLVPSGGGYDGSSTTASRVIAQAAQADFNGTVRWLATNPGRFGREDLKGLSEAVTEELNGRAWDFLAGHSSDGTLAVLVPAIQFAVLNNASGQGPAIWEWLNGQSDEPATLQLREAVLRGAGFHHPELAVRMAADFSASPAGEAEAKQLAESLLNGGHLLHRLDGLMVQAPEGFKSTLLHTAFDLLYPDTMTDPHPPGSIGCLSCTRMSAWQGSSASPELGGLKLPKRRSLGREASRQANLKLQRLLPLPQVGRRRILSQRLNGWLRCRLG